MSSGKKVEIFPSANDAFKWAHQAMEEKKWREAAQRWALLRTVYVSDSAAWVQGAIAHKELKEYGQAEELLAYAQKNFPQNKNSFIQTVWLYLEQKNWVEAERVIAALKMCFPDDPAGWVLLAERYSMAEEYERANVFNREALEKFPDRPWPLRQAILFAQERQDWKRVQMLSAQMREKFPDHAKGYRAGILAAEKLGDADAAQKIRGEEKFGGNRLVSSAVPQKQNLFSASPRTHRSLFEFADLVWTKSRLNLKSEASRDHLRYLWWILDPLLYMAVFYLVFGVLMQRGGPGYVGYLLTGLVAFQWFAKTIQHTSGSILAGRGLMNQVKISPLFFPLVRIVQNTGKQLVVFLILAIFLVFYGLPPTVHWLALFVVMASQLVFMGIVGCALALVIPFARDLQNLIPTGIQFMLFVSGIFYNTERIPEQWRTLFFANPIALLIEQYRQVLLHNQWPYWPSLLYLWLACLVMGYGVWRFYRRFEAVYPRVVLE